MVVAADGMMVPAFCAQTESAGVVYHWSNTLKGSALDLGMFLFLADQRLFKEKLRRIPFY